MISKLKLVSLGPVLMTPLFLKVPLPSQSLILLGIFFFFLIFILFIYFLPFFLYFSPSLIIISSISDLCTEVSLYLIKSSWFQFPRASASVSFQFAKRKTGGVVLNEKKATVGEIRGDGSRYGFLLSFFGPLFNIFYFYLIIFFLDRILFKEPGRVNKFTVCLLVIRPDDDVCFVFIFIPSDPFNQ